MSDKSYDLFKKTFAIVLPSACTCYLVFGEFFNLPGVAVVEWLGVIGIRALWKVVEDARKAYYGGGGDDELHADAVDE